MARPFETGLQVSATFNRLPRELLYFKVSTAFNHENFWKWAWIKTN